MSEIRPLDEIRRLLATITSPAKAAATARRIARLLNDVEDEVRTAKKFVRTPKRGIAAVVYTVEVTSLGESVAEHRPNGSSKPFRCPRAVYDAVVDVLARTSSALSSSEIADAIEHRTGIRPGDHQFRVPLRLWVHVQPALLLRSRARYRPADPKTFQAETAKLWADLRS